MNYKTKTSPSEVILSIFENHVGISKVLKYCGVLFLFLCGSVNAAGGIGSVWSTGSTDDSISIVWTIPGGNYDHVGSQYKVCYRKTPTLNVCNGSPDFSPSNSFTASGLSSGTEYKFKVWCYCKKKNWRGKWKDPKWRKIGTYKQSTLPEQQPDVLVSNISVIGVGIAASGSSASIDVQVDFTNPVNFEFIRTCYKKAINFTSLKSICSKVDKPSDVWGSSDHGRGWLDVSPAISGIIFSFEDLKNCKQYKVVSYGFYSGLNNGLLLGQTNVHTPGLCKANKFKFAIADDHTGTVLAEYAERIDQYYDKQLFEHLVRRYDSSLLSMHKIMIDDERVDIVSPKRLIEYLINSDTELWEQWQKEDGLFDESLTLELFVAKQYPELYRDIVDDIKDVGELK